MNAYFQPICGSSSRNSAIVGLHTAAVAGLILLISMVAHAETTTVCAPLDAALRLRVLQVAARNMGTELTLPVIDSEEVVPNTCYWKLSTSVSQKKGHVILYVSPDHRFLSPVLWDLALDYDTEDAKTNNRLLSEADSDQPPVLGPKDALVTVVIFSDLQCPYCAAFSQWVEQYQKDNPGKLKLIYRNSPLPMHKWAKQAARAGICIGQQSPEAFWKFQDYMFTKQKETNPDNLGDQVNQFLDASPNIRTDRYLACMTATFPDSVLNRDLAEASTYRIHSTPTVFMNGRRHGGFASESDFATAVEASISKKTVLKGETTK